MDGIGLKECGSGLNGTFEVGSVEKEEQLVTAITKVRKMCSKFTLQELTSNMLHNSRNSSTEK